MRLHLVSVVCAVVVVSSCGGGPDGPRLTGSITAVESSGTTLGIEFPTETALYADSTRTPDNEFSATCSIVPGTGSTGSSVTLHFERHYPFASDPCSFSGINRLDIARDDTGTTLRVEQCPSNGYGDAATCTATSVVTIGDAATISLTHCTVSGFGGATATVDGTLTISHCAPM